MDHAAFRRASRFLNLPPVAFALFTGSRIPCIVKPLLYFSDALAVGRLELGFGSVRIDPESGPCINLFHLLFGLVIYGNEY